MRAIQRTPAFARQRHGTPQKSNKRVKRRRRGRRLRMLCFLLHLPDCAAAFRSCSLRRRRSIIAGCCVFDVRKLRCSEVEASPNHRS